MKSWKRLFSRQAPPDEKFDEIGNAQDARFTTWLEKEGTFSSSPHFQADLRARLQTQLLTQLAASPAPARSTPKVLLLRLTPVAVGLASILIFMVVLLSGLAVSVNDRVTPVAALTTPDANSQPADGKLNFLYDQSTEDYVNLDDASKTLGFTPRLPEYIPAGYKLDNAALTYIEPSQPVRSTSPNRLPTPAPDSNGAIPGPQGLQFQIASIQPQANNEVQVYQLRAPSEEANGPRFNIQGAQGFTRQMVQGAIGYFIQGARWRVNYAGPPPSPRPNPNQISKASGNNGTPGAMPGHPNMTPGSQMHPPFGMGMDGKRPPPGVRPSQMRLAFGQSENPNSNRPGFYIDFQPQGADGKVSRSLVWQKDGVLTVLVTGDSFAQSELQRIADSFKEHHPAKQ